MKIRLSYPHLAEIIDALQDDSIESVAEQFGIPIPALQTLPERLQRTNPHDIRTHGLMLEFEDPEESARHAAQELMEISRTKGLVINGAVVQEAELRRLLIPKPEHDIPPSERPSRPATEPYPPKRKMRKPRGPDTKPRKRRGPNRGPLRNPKLSDADVDRINQMLNGNKDK